MSSPYTYMYMKVQKATSGKSPEEWCYGSTTKDFHDFKKHIKCKRAFNSSAVLLYCSLVTSLLSYMTNSKLLHPLRAKSTCIHMQQAEPIPLPCTSTWIIHLSNYRIIRGSDFMKYSVIHLKRLRQLEGDLLLSSNIIVAKGPTQTTE